MGLAKPLRSLSLMLLAEGRSEAREGGGTDTQHSPQDGVDRPTDRTKFSLYKQTMDLSIQTEARPWGGMFSNPKAQRLTDRKTDRQRVPYPLMKFPCQVPSLKDLRHPCPELGGAQQPTSPAAACRRCPLAAWLPPCRSAPPRSPPPLEQLSRTGVTKSGMGPRARVACAEERDPWDSQPPPTLHLFPFFLPCYLDWHPQRAGAWPEWPGALQGPAAASSLQQDPKPSKSKAHSAFGKRQPHHPCPPGPSLPPSYPSPASMSLTYLLKGGVHSKPLLLASVSQPLRTLPLKFPWHWPCLSAESRHLCLPGSGEGVEQTKPAPGY